jgi:hypothetical protein
MPQGWSPVRQDERMSDGLGQRMVYRPLLSRISAAGYAVFALWWAVDDLRTGDVERIAVVGPVLLALGAVVYGVFWRPAVVVDDTGVELRNIVRDIRVPWPVLAAVETKYALTLVVGERSYRSWAAGAPGRPAPLAHRASARDHHPTGDASTVQSSRSLRGDSGAAAFMVEQRWEQRRSDPLPEGAGVTVRYQWAWPSVAAGAALAGWLAALLN